MILVSLRSFSYARIKNGNMNYRLLIFATCMLLTACKDNRKEADIEECVMSFGNTYFNYDFKNALKHSTPESKKWITYTASVVTPDDIPALVSKEPATVSIEDIIIYSGDTTATAIISVYNWLKPDSFGTHGTIKPKEVFRLNTVSRDGKWMVDFRTEDLLRNGK